MWQSKSLHKVTKSPLASETMALAEAAGAGYFLAQITQEIFNLKKKFTIVKVNKSLVDHLSNSKVIQDVHLRVNIARLCEMVKLQEISINWVHGSFQLADALTKYDASTSILVEVLKKGCL